MNQSITHIEARETDTRYLAEVLSSTPITPVSAAEEVRELVLAVDSPGVTYSPGQSLGVLAPGSPEFGNKTALRLYSVADLPERDPDGRTRLRICVRRCSYVDAYSGEIYRGRVSNYLCDLDPGTLLTLTGPYELPFAVPEDHDANLILIATGTGIAPFRAFVKHLYWDVLDWTGRVWLFYGARRGLEMLYMNDEKDDFAQYYDRDTFEAFKALSPRPNWSDPIAWDLALAERSSELLKMMDDPKTYVYVAGLEAMREDLDGAFGKILGSTRRWSRRKAELMAGGRWVEVLY